MVKNYFENKVVFITGAGNGIGRALAMEMAVRGARLIVTDLHNKYAEDTVQMIREMIPEAYIRHSALDVSDEKAFENVFKFALQELGRVDIMVNNAGHSIGGPLENLSLSDWRSVMDVNFYGMVQGSNLALKQMIKQGNGHIVNIASAAGLSYYMPLSSTYVTTKAAAIRYSKALEIESQEFGIKTTTICPAFISTEFADRLKFQEGSGKLEPEIRKALKNGMPLEKAIQTMIRGISKQKRFLVFPFQAHFLLFIERYLPGLNRALILKNLKFLRS